MNENAPKERGELSERKRQILRAVVDAYITGGEPVGSKYLSGEGGFQYSSATIRNEMAELEELGYLRQPHTSAGRIPSERGYRFYVDSLMQAYRMTAAELAEINKLAHLKLLEMDKILAQAGRLMSLLTNYPAITALPAPKATVIRQFRLMRLDIISLLLVMVTDCAGNAGAKTARVPSCGADDETAEAVEHILNARFTGYTADQITMPLMMELSSALAAIGCPELAQTLLSAIYECLSSGTEESDIRFEGVGKLMQYPEYSDPERIGGLLQLLDGRSDLLDIVRRSDSDSVNVYIGDETSVEGLRGSTVVLKKLRSGGQVVGAVGVIGPCRMKYSKVVTMLEHFARSLEASDSLESGEAETADGMTQYYDPPGGNDE